MRAGGRTKGAARRVTSPIRLPGSSATSGASASQPERGARGGAVGLERNLVGQRMADELGAHVVRRVELGLERQQAQHQVDSAVPIVRTRPCRHAHTCGLTYCTVRMPAALSPLREAQVELRGVDADEHVRARRQEARAQRRAQPQQARQVREHLREPHDRELIGGAQRLAACGQHLRTRRRRRTRARGTRARRAAISAAPEGVPGMLARNDPDPQRPRGLQRSARGVHRTRLRWRRG